MNLGIFFTWERITSEHETKDWTFWGQQQLAGQNKFTSIESGHTHIIQTSY